jgi:hypothetical protein
MTNPIPVSINLRGDLEKVLDEKINEMGIKPKKGRKSHPADARSLFCIYLNAIRRRVEPKPRTVHFSTQLQIQIPQQNSDYQNALNTIRSLAETGGDLNPYLSRKLSEDYNDMLMNDWKIHHFHLGTTLNVQGVIKGTKELLFGWITDTEFYGIGIFDHNSFPEKELLEIIQNDWPQLLKKTDAKSRGIIDVHDPYTPEERKQLRDAGISIVTKLHDGTITFPPGGGYATDGTSMEVSMEVMKILQPIWDLQLGIKSNPQQYVQLIQAQTGITLKELKIILINTIQGFKVIEESTGSVLAKWE